ncbi:MAG: TonB family protein [Bacteroidota bacterium]
MKKLWLLLGLILGTNALVWAQTETPGINEFVFVDEEPKPSNLAEVREAIGYPEMAIQQNLQGNVVIRVLVDTTGEYLDHSVIASAHPVLGKAVEDHIADLTFSPAILKNKPTRFWVNIPFNFRLVNEEEERLKASVDSLSKLITTNPEDYELYHKRGVEQSQLGNNDEALEDLNKSLALNPRKNKKKKAKNTYAYLVYSLYSRAAVLVGMEKYDDAIADYAEAFALMGEMKYQDSAVDAMQPLLYLERGYTYQLKNEYEMARKDYRWVLDNDSLQKCTVYTLLSDMGLEENNYEELSWVYTGLMECDTANTYLPYSRGYYRLKAGEYEGALKDFETAIKRNKNMLIRIAAHNHMALTHMKMGQTMDAQASIDKALLINALNPQSYYFRAMLKEKAGDAEGACKDYRNAMEFGLSGEDAEKCIEKLNAACGGWEIEE